MENEINETTSYEVVQSKRFSNELPAVIDGGALAPSDLLSKLDEMQAGVALDLQNLALAQGECVRVVFLGMKYIAIADKYSQDENAEKTLFAAIFQKSDGSLHFSAASMVVNTFNRLPNGGAYEITFSGLKKTASGRNMHHFLIKPLS